MSLPLGTASLLGAFPFSFLFFFFFSSSLFSPLLPFLLFLSLLTTRVTEMKTLEGKLEGQHDVDQGWIKDVRSANGGEGLVPLIVPRINFEGFHPRTFSLHRKEKFDGFVIESSFISPMGISTPKAIDFLELLGKELHRIEKKFILVLPPQRTQPILSPSDFQRLSSVVDHFSLMTYDYSQRSGPNAPLPWTRDAVTSLFSSSEDSTFLKSKVLLGIPFYGYLWEEGKGPEAILGHQFVDILRKHKPKIEWDSNAHEHFIVFEQNKRVYFPSLQFLQDRLDLAMELGTGISIWEIGQGLDYFFDLL